ncbi:MAG: hypothetical protein K6G72_08635 [Lachnospiraceae bacterium]|nr:hypothetical protein [Lachnospiraceae bacterium]
MEQVVFNNGKAMLDLVLLDEDLYNLETGDYVFHYSEDGSIATYSLDIKEAMELAEKALEGQEYWGAYLGPGGWIYDDPSSDFYDKECPSNLSYCEEVYSTGRWYKTSDLQLEWAK